VSKLQLISGWGIVHSTLSATPPAYFKKCDEDFWPVSTKDAQDKVNWRLRIEGKPDVKTACVCVYMVFQAVMMSRRQTEG